MPVGPAPMIATDVSPPISTTHRSPTPAGAGLSDHASGWWLPDVAVRSGLRGELGDDRQQVPRRRVDVALSGDHDGRHGLIATGRAADQLRGGRVSPDVAPACVHAAAGQRAPQASAVRAARLPEHLHRRAGRFAFGWLQRHGEGTRWRARRHPEWNRNFSSALAAGPPNCDLAAVPLNRWRPRAAFPSTNQGRRRPQSWLEPPVRPTTGPGGGVLNEALQADA